MAAQKTWFPKVSAICDTASHLVLGAIIDCGPKIDHVEFEAHSR